MNEEGAFSWHVGMLPFIWKPLRSPNNGDALPDALPFALEVDRRMGTLRQTKNRDVSQALSRAYSRGSVITGLMDEHGIGRDYAEDFLRFLKLQMPHGQFAGVRVLEVGCGTGYLLHRLKQLGAEVCGLEPGPHGQQGAQRFDVPIIQDLFPSERIRGKFDLVIMYAVLEHIEDPEAFMGSLAKVVDVGGRLALSVPNCEPYVTSGDVSMLFHEHWSYFTRETLNAALVCGGASAVAVEESGFGGALYAMASIGRQAGLVGSVVVQTQVEQAQRLRQLAKVACARFTRRLTQAAARKQTVGIYVPARAINVLALSRTDLSHCRFFDDNVLLHGTYFPGIPIPIETRQDLETRPTDWVFIMSRSFGRKIAAELRRSLGTTSQIVTWDDM